MLFCPSFTQSERFLQTDQLIIRLQVVVVTNVIRMLMRNVIVNVFKSDAVIWWAAIFCRYYSPLLSLPSLPPSLSSLSLPPPKLNPPPLPQKPVSAAACEYRYTMAPLQGPLHQLSAILTSSPKALLTQAIRLPGPRQKSSQCARHKRKTRSPRGREREGCKPKTVGPLASCLFWSEIRV